MSKSSLDWQQASQKLYRQIQSDEAVRRKQAARAKAEARQRKLAARVERARLERKIAECLRVLQRARQDARTQAQQGFVAAERTIEQMQRDCPDFAGFLGHLFSDQGGDVIARKYFLPLVLRTKYHRGKTFHLCLAWRLVTWRCFRNAVRGWLSRRFRPVIPCSIILVEQRSWPTRTEHGYVRLTGDAYQTANYSDFAAADLQFLKNDLIVPLTALTNPERVFQILFSIWQGRYPADSLFGPLPEPKADPDASIPTLQSTEQTA